MINVYLILSILLIQCSSKIIYKPLKIQFDYSNIVLRNKEILNYVKEEFDNIQYYINDLFYSKETGNVLKFISKISTPYLICEDKTRFIFDKNNIDKTTSLIVIPKFNINVNNNKEKNNYNNPILFQCIKEEIKPLVIILNFLFLSEKEMLQKIKENFSNLNYHWLIIRFIISSLGFNKQNLIQRNIPNNIIGTNQNKLTKYNFYRAFQKFTLLTNYLKLSSQDNERYLDFWPSFPKFNDIMRKNINPKKISPSITEMTLHLMEAIGYKSKFCELLFYYDICYKVDQKCINNFDIYYYYIYYTIDESNKRWICYTKNEEQFRNKQCGNNYGVLLNIDSLHKYLLIDYLRKKEKQNLVLLKPSKYCPREHPRTVFFSSVKPKEDPYQYRYKERIEEITLNDPKYYVISNTYTYHYNVKYFTANYNGVFSYNYKRNWNYNYFWEFYPLENYTGLYIIKNKYQFIGQFPPENTYKDGINKFYNKLKGKFPNEFNYIPETFMWPDQKDDINKKFINYTYDPNDVWLFKPSRDSFGNGIKIIESYNTIKKSIYNYFLVSRYIMNPMLIKNKKFDVRAYVLVTGMNPLKIYFYKDGYLKIPVKDFTLDYKYINDMCVHITTSDVNLKCFKGKEYIYDTDIYDENSNFWSYMFFERYCNKNGINYTYIIEQMKDIFIKTFISLNSDFIKLIKEKHLKDRNLFQLYGFDLLIDNNYKVFLLELNRNPSMRGGHAVADYIYENIIADTLNIVGIVPFAHDDNQEPFDNNIYFYSNKTEEIVDDTLCELSRPRGLFELIYPLKDNINKYKKFYDNITHENKLLWDKLLESNGEYN